MMRGTDSLLADIDNLVGLTDAQRIDLSRLVDNALYQADTDARAECAALLRASSAGLESHFRKAS